MENKKEYAVSYYGGHVSAWLCVVVAILGIMYLLLGRGGGTKSMMVALFFTLVLGLVLAKDRKAYGEEMLVNLRESMFCVICVAFFMAKPVVFSAEDQRPDPGADLGGGRASCQYRLYPRGGIF